MIPKIIHYCWFGGNPLPELAQKCIESWKKFCPEYEIIEWNESNFDIAANVYAKEAYEAKKWAFVSDVARLYALVTVGGIYMDTDVEVLKPLDEFLSLEAFSGFETETAIPTGIMAAEKGQPLFAELLHDYDNVHFLREDGTPDCTTNVIRITNLCLKYGLKLNNQKQTVRGFTLFPCDYFCPKNPATKELRITDHTVTIHHFDGSWLSDEERLQVKLRDKYSKRMPKTAARFLAKFVSVKRYRGFKAAMAEFFKWLKK